MSAYAHRTIRRIPSPPTMQRAPACQLLRCYRSSARIGGYTALLPERTVHDSVIVVNATRLSNGADRDTIRGVNEKFRALLPPGQGLRR